MKIDVFLIILLFLWPGYNNRFEIKKEYYSVDKISDSRFSNDSNKGSKQCVGLCLLINDSLYSSDEGEFLIVPGKANQVVVRVDESLSQNKNLKAIVIRKLPNGRSITDSKKFGEPERVAQFDLGPMSAAPEYIYDAGVVYMKGYQLSIHVEDVEGKYIGGWDFEQGLSKQKTTERTGMSDGDPFVKLVRMQILGKDRQLFDPKYGSMPMFSLRLASEVLSNQDDVRILVGLNEGESPVQINAVLTITDSRGKEIWKRQIHLERGAEWKGYPVATSKWPTGDYRVELLPVIEGRVWPDGSAVTYRIGGARLTIVRFLFLPWQIGSFKEINRVKIYGSMISNKHTQTGELGSLMKQIGDFSLYPLKMCRLSAGEITTSTLWFIVCRQMVIMLFLQR